MAPRKPKSRQGEAKQKSPIKKSFSKIDKAPKLNKVAAKKEATPKKAATPKTVAQRKEGESSSKTSSSKARRLRKFKSMMRRYLAGDQSVKPSKDQLKRIMKMSGSGFSPHLNVSPKPGTAATTPTTTKEQKNKGKKAVKNKPKKQQKPATAGEEGSDDDDDDEDDDDMEVESGA